MDRLSGSDGEARVLEDVRFLAEAIGPRPPTSPQEARAAEWLADQLRAAGYEVTVDPFPAARSFIPTYVTLTTLGLLSFALAWWQPAFGALGAALAAALMAAENLTFSAVSRVLARGRSRNVEASRPPGGESEQEIVVTAHLDSAVAGDLRNMKVVRLLFLGMLGSCLAIGLLAAAVQLGTPSVALWFGAPCALLLAASTLVAMRQYLCSPPVAGANDNASGVAALLAAARELPPLRRSTIRFVGTGAEESGLMGAARLVGRGRFDPQRTWFINVDMVGEGTLRAGCEEGMLVRLAADPHLLDLALEEGTAAGLEVRPASLRSMSTDACVPMIRGYRAVTLFSGQSHWHRLSDTVDNVSPATVAQAAVLVRRMIVRLDEE